MQSSTTHTSAATTFFRDTWASLPSNGPGSSGHLQTGASGPAVDTTGRHDPAPHASPAPLKSILKKSREDSLYPSAAATPTTHFNDSSMTNFESEQLVQHRIDQQIQQEMKHQNAMRGHPSGSPGLSERLGQLSMPSSSYHNTPVSTSPPRLGHTYAVPPTEPQASTTMNTTFSSPSKLAANVTLNPAHMYSQDFVDQLRKQHQRLQRESLDKIRELEMSATRTVESLRNESKAVKEQLHMSEIHHNEEINRVRESHSRDLNETLASYERELNKTREEHRREVEKVKLWAQQQLAAAETNKDAQVDSMHRKIRDLEHAHSVKLQEVQELNHQRIAELQRLLHEETNRLADAREELLTLKVQHADESNLLRGEIRILQQTVASREADIVEWRSRFTNETAQSKRELESKEKDYQALIGNIRHEQRLQRESMENLIRDQEDQITRLEKDFRELQTKHADQLSATATELEQLQIAIDSSQRMFERQAEENRRLGVKVQELTRENDIMNREISLLEGEEKRLKLENDHFRSNMERLERLVYGKKEALMYSSSKRLQ
eukprot:GILK01004223.1.p1 GENE.GILK01004223.1~~GILK01004223.1.p1  ORF type:complete len:635 (+),score=128.81 GILK01004223.1:251-1906(+)